MLFYHGGIKKGKRRSKHVFLYTQRVFATRSEGFFTRLFYAGRQGGAMVMLQVNASLQLVPPIVEISFGIPRPLWLNVPVSINGSANDHGQLVV
jgi:hypothetical protein